MPRKASPPSIHQTATGNDNIQVAGENNTVNVSQTFIQKVINIFKSDTETTEQRNRRIMLGHVENFWVKGILEKSLYGAALLDLGIKEHPEAVNYPWAIKREAAKETLPPGTSMLEVFQQIGMGRSLLILGAPGSGKTTMLLELTRELIECARQDVTEPIPVVFNLSSWTEKLSLADWLAGQLNTIYYIPKKIAPTWIEENKMLLLLDGLDEVRQESRDPCVSAINEFRKDNGLTGLVVCSRTLDYAELKTRLALDGAIEIQPLTSNQVDEYFECYGDQFAGIRQVLEKDTILREMAETPLFLSIMMLAYREAESKDIVVSDDFDLQRKHLFDTYIERMFERPRLSNDHFKKKDVLHWLSWLAQTMIERNQVPYLLEYMQPKWLTRKELWKYRLVLALIFAPLIWLGVKLGAVLLSVMLSLLFVRYVGRLEIMLVETLIWDLNRSLKMIRRWRVFLLLCVLITLIIGALSSGLIFGLILGLSNGLLMGIFLGLAGGLATKPISQTTHPGQKISFSLANSLFVSLFYGLILGLLCGLFVGLLVGPAIGLRAALAIGPALGLSLGLLSGGFAVFQHYTLRLIIAANSRLPWRIVPFLNYCVGRIFLRRVGGGYIFVHRLLMEHFAAIYKEEEI